MSENLHPYHLKHNSFFRITIGIVIIKITVVITFHNSVLKEKAKLSGILSMESMKILPVFVTIKYAGINLSVVFVSKLNPPKIIAPRITKDVTVQYRHLDFVFISPQHIVALK